jgi:hypothetical protein
MSEPWNEPFPDDYRDSITRPVHYEDQSDSFARSRKVWGYDATGMRCFYQHEFTCSEERFDVDEFPIQVDVFWERVTAWRLHGGQWLKLRKWTDRMDHCSRNVVTEPFEVVGENQLQR